MEENLDKDSEFYFCGPVGFMEAIKNILLEMGIKEENIHFEFFK